jgi:hypothetical protein
MEWIKTSERKPEIDQEIEITCKHWECNWRGNFDFPYIDKGTYDKFGNFWDSEGARVHDPEYWRPYQPERSKREDSFFVELGSDIGLSFNTSQGIKRLAPGKSYDQNLDEL